MDKKVLILGASGFLGQELYDFLTEKDFDCVGTSYTSPRKDFIKVNLIPRENLENLVNEISPDVIINSTKLGGFFDKNPDLTRKVNYGINKTLLQIFGGKILLFSTDHVFDGEKGDYTELDIPNPINNYGKTKREGELALINSDSDFLICRLGILYHPTNPNKGFPKFVYENLSDGKEINCWTDVISSPTNVLDVCKAVEKLLKTNASGIYHLAGSKKMSRYHFAWEIADRFNLNKDLVLPIDYQGEKPMPRDTSMKTIKTIF